MDALVLQYIIVTVLVAFACYMIFKMVRKNFSSGKFSSKKPHCDKNCGCS